MIDGRCYIECSVQTELLALALAQAEACELQRAADEGAAEPSTGARPQPSAQGPLPYGGDIQAAMHARDREAIRTLMAARDVTHERSVSPPPAVPSEASVTQSEAYELGDQVEAMYRPGGSWSRAMVVRTEDHGVLGLVFDGYTDTVVVPKSRVRAR